MPEMVQLAVSAGRASSERAITLVEVSYEGGSLHRVTHPYTIYIQLCYLSRWPVSNGCRKSPDHLATTSVCQTCHTTFGFDLLRYVDHVEVFGKCSECHNGNLAIGKPKIIS